MNVFRGALFQITLEQTEMDVRRETGDGSHREGGQSWVSRGGNRGERGGGQRPRVHQIVRTAVVLAEIDDASQLASAERGLSDRW